jgi:carboxylesterase
LPSDRYAFLKTRGLFEDPRYQPFRLHAEGGAGRKAAVLVHGFPGTPGDMRPLGEAFAEAGWTVDAPLLPGFGSQIGTLPERRFEEWAIAAAEALEALMRDHERVVIVGHSMGGAVALVAAAEVRPAGQVLLAPRWRYGGALRDMFWPVLRLWAGRWRPLSSADFDDEQIREGIHRFLPGIDLDDEGVRTELRDFTVPTHVLDQLRKLGKAARKSVSRVAFPTLVIHGLRDGLVPLEDSEELAARIPGGARLELLDATHDVVDPEDGAWARVWRTIADFVEPLGRA